MIVLLLFAEALKANPDLTANILHKIYSDIWKNEVMPQDWNSNDCSIIIRSAAIWSVHDRSFLKPACCSLSFSSTAFNSLVGNIITTCNAESYMKANLLKVLMSGQE
jgi:hypothetical protein